jgi:OPA family glycerol-3-phosphate transporter-like MFS transporter
MALIFGLLVRNRPEDAGLPPVVEATQADGTQATAVEHLTAGQVLRMTLSNRVLWVLAVAFFCSNAVRYAFMNWSIQYISRFHGEPLGNSTFKAVALPLFGVVAAISAGWASDVFFQGRRAPLSAIMLFALSILCVGFAMVPRGQVTLAMALLGLAGFLIYGPDMLMSGAATVDFSPRARPLPPPVSP